MIRKMDEDEPLVQEKIINPHLVNSSWYDFHCILNYFPGKSGISSLVETAINWLNCIQVNHMSVPSIRPFHESCTGPKVISDSHPESFRIKNSKRLPSKIAYGIARH